MDFQSVRNTSQSTGRYRHEFLVDVFGADGRSPREFAKDAGVSHTKIYEALEGECKKIDTLSLIVTALRGRRPKLKMKHLFDDELTRTRFRRLVSLGEAAGR